MRIHLVFQVAVFSSHHNKSENILVRAYGGGRVERMERIIFQKRRIFSLFGIGMKCSGPFFCAFALLSSSFWLIVEINGTNERKHLRILMAKL